MQHVLGSQQLGDVALKRAPEADDETLHRRDRMMELGIKTCKLVVVKQIR